MSNNPQWKMFQPPESHSSPLHDILDLQHTTMQSKQAYRNGSYSGEYPSSPRDGHNNGVKSGGGGGGGGGRFQSSGYGADACPMGDSAYSSGNTASSNYETSSHPPIRETGIIEKLLHSYGFIQCCERQARLFFHFSQFSGNTEHLKIGDPVEFEMTYDRRTGKPIASTVTKIAPEVVLSEARVTGTVTTEVKGEGSGDNTGRISYENRGECFFLPYTKDDVEGNVVLRTGDAVSFQIATNQRGTLGACHVRFENPQHPVKYHGVICSMKENFGFIERADVVKEIFFHYSEAKTEEELTLGDDVEFLIQTRNGKEVACNIFKLPGGSVVFEDVSPDTMRGQVLKPLERGNGGPAPRQNDPLPGRIRYRAPDHSEVEVPFGDKDQCGEFTLRHGDWVRFQVATDRRDRLRRATNISLLDESFSVSGERRERGLVRTLRDGFGYLRCVERERPMLFRFTEVLRLGRELSIGDEVEFTVDPPTTFGKCDMRQAAVRIKHLPPGSVAFESLVERAVRGSVQEAHRPSDDRRPDDRRSIERRSDDRRNDDRRIDERRIDDRRIDERRIDDRRIDDRRIDERRIDDRRIDDRRIDDRRIDDRRIDERRIDDCRITDRRIDDCRITDRRIDDCRIADRRIDDCRITDRRIDDCRIADRRIDDCRITDRRIDERRIDDRRIDDRRDDRRTDDRRIDDRRIDDRRTDERRIDDRRTDERRTDSPSDDYDGLLVANMNQNKKTLPFRTKRGESKQPRQGDKVMFDVYQVKRTKELVALGVEVVGGADGVANGAGRPPAHGYVAALKDGFGFIETADHSKEVFFHFSNLEGAVESLELGTEVEYAVGRGGCGGGCASAEWVRALPRGTLPQPRAADPPVPGVVTRTLRALNPDQQQYCGLVQADAGGSHEFGITGLKCKREILQVGDPVTFQVDAEGRAANIVPVRKKRRAVVDAIKGGFGFLSLTSFGGEETGEARRLFFHMSEVRSGSAGTDLQPGDTVEFVMLTNPRNGKSSACNVVKIARVCSKTRPERLLARLRTASLEDSGAPRVVALRAPRGPDGTRGFRRARARPE